MPTLDLCAGPYSNTGVFAGTIAGYLFGLDWKNALSANAIGIFFSCLIVWVTTVVATGGFNWAAKEALELGFDKLWDYTKSIDLFVIRTDIRFTANWFLIL